MVMQKPEVLTPQKVADLCTLWCAAGQRVTGGVSKFRQHQQFMHVLWAQNKTGRTKRVDKVMSRINTCHAEHGKRYTYLELYCVVMPHRLKLEDVDRQEARDGTPEARVTAMYDDPRERRTSPYQGRTTPRRDNSKERRLNVSNARSRQRRDSESYRYGSGEHRSGSHSCERERSKSPSRRNDRPRTPNGSRWDGNRERSNSRNLSTNADPKHRGRANSQDWNKIWSRTGNRSLGKDPRTAERDRSRSTRRGDQPRARGLGTVKPVRILFGCTLSDTSPISAIQGNSEFILFISLEVANFTFLVLTRPAVCACALLVFLLACACSVFCNAGRSFEISPQSVLIVLVVSCYGNGKESEATATPVNDRRPGVKDLAKLWCGASAHTGCRPWVHHRTSEQTGVR